MYNIILNAFQIINELLTAGIAITAFSLLLYAFTFNLRDRVARSFAIILICVVIVFVGDTIGSTLNTPREMEFWLRLQWVGIVFLPSAYLHFSDALLATTGRPSRGLRRITARMAYLISFVFFLTIPFSILVGHLVQNAFPAPYLQRTWLTLVFTLFYTGGMVGSWVNFFRAYQRTVTSTSRRRMQYLLAGALAPALGSFPYLLFGYNLASAHPLLFWAAALLANIMVYGLLIVMAYSVAFFGVSWPDRVVKRRLFKWLMRGPVTGSIVLGVTTIVRRSGIYFGIEYSTAVPISMVATVLIVEHMITLVAPLWERWMFHGGDQSNMQLLTSLEERLLTSGDLRQFLESVLAAVCDRFQVSSAFIVTLGAKGLEMVVTIGGDKFLEDDISQDFLQMVSQNGFGHGLFTWGDYWLIPLSGENNDSEKLLGLMGFRRQPNQVLDGDQHDALFKLGNRAAMALEDRNHQQQIVSSLESLSPEMDMIQRLRAASRYDSTNVLTSSENPLEYKDLARWVKDALSHYWGGPKLTQSPLLNLKIVQEAMPAHEGNQANAMRAILNQAIEQTRPEGERRFTGEWILYNILEMKFLEGRKVREIAMRLAMSEADLYRKQRVAIEAVAAAIVEMEQKARIEENNLEPLEELQETSDI
jgi:hypothetical protein